MAKTASKAKKQAKILIIDDDPDLIDATTMVLENKGYKVISALNGDEGMKKVREAKPDLIILDVVMPGKDGFAVCEMLKGDPQLGKIPVIMLTAFAQMKEQTSVSVSQGMTCEADDYVDKPFETVDLLKRMERLLARKA